MCWVGVHRKTKMPSKPETTTAPCCMVYIAVGHVIWNMEQISREDLAHLPGAH